MRNTRSRFWILAGAGLAACLSQAACGSPGDDAPSDALDLAQPADLRASSVTGRRVRTHVSDTGETSDTAVDLSAATIEALVPTADGTGYVTYPGTGSSDGTFTIPAVPEGVSYLLHYFHTDSLRHYYVRTSERSVDLSYYSGQRIGAKTGTANTALTWSGVTGIDAWAATDQLLYYSADNELYLYGTAPATGSTALNLTQSLNGSLLPDSGAGDRVYVLQQRSTTSASGITALAVSKAVKLSDLTVTDGATTTVTSAQAAFTAPPVQSASFDFRCSEFAAYKSAAAPAANVGASVRCDLYALALPGGATLPYGEYTSSADLLAYTTTSASDVSTGLLRFGNPFPSSYGVFGYAAASYGASYTAPGGTIATTVTATISRRAPLGELTAGPITVLVGPPTALRIDGADATAPSAAVRTTPTLSWSAPQTGTPSHYEVNVIRLSLRTGTTRTIQTAFARFLTTEARLVLPAGVLTAGESYVFSIGSQLRPGADPQKPLRGSLPSSSAVALTALVTPVQ